MSLDKRDLYRLPWSMNDNPIAWLEITDVCNIYCEGCYRQRMTGHKTLDEVKEEIAFFKQWRNPDNVSIAGGEPLIHPQIVDIVAHIAAERHQADHPDQRAGPEAGAAPRAEEGGSRRVSPSTSTAIRTGRTGKTRPRPI